MLGLGCVILSNPIVQYCADMFFQWCRTRALLNLLVCRLESCIFHNKLKFPVVAYPRKCKYPGVVKHLRGKPEHSEQFSHINWIWSTYPDHCIKHTHADDGVLVIRAMSALPVISSTQLSTHTVNHITAFCEISIVFCCTKSVTCALPQISIYIDIRKTVKSNERLPTFPQWSSTVKWWF